jgi:hypothetical protein
VLEIRHWPCLVDLGSNMYLFCNFSSSIFLFAHSINQPISPPTKHHRRHRRCPPSQVMELGGCDFFDLTNGRRVRDPLLRRDYFRQMCLCTLQLHQVCVCKGQTEEIDREPKMEIDDNDSKAFVSTKNRGAEYQRIPCVCACSCQRNTWKNSVFHSPDFWRRPHLMRSRLITAGQGAPRSQARKLYHGIARGLPCMLSTRLCLCLCLLCAHLSRHVCQVAVGGGRGRGGRERCAQARSECGRRTGRAVSGTAAA